VATAPTTTSTPVGTLTVDLLDLLTDSNSQRSRDGWASVLAPAKGKNWVGGRDRRIRAIARLCAERSGTNPVRVLVLESFYKGGGDRGAYDSVAWYCHEGPVAAIPALDALDVAAVNPSAFGRMALSAKGLLVKDSAKLPLVWDWDEVFIVSYIDGQQCQQRAWHYLEDRQEMQETKPRTAAELLPEVRAAVNLVQVANWNLPERKHYFASVFVNLIDQFGEFGVGGKALPEKEF
jgi:hypothetical protein